MKTKEELQKELKAIIEQEQNELIEKALPEFKKYEGKFFKYKNSYSLPETKSDYWFKYTKVVSVTKDDLYISGERVLSYFTGISFETDKHGQIYIHTKEHDFTHSLQKEITEKEFMKAWKEVNNRINSLVNPSYPHP